MIKRLLGLWLSVCMVITLLPVSAMAAEEANTPIGERGEITSFAPLTATEKTVLIGTSIRDLELPESLTAAVRTSITADNGTLQEPMQVSDNSDKGSESEDLEEETPVEASENMDKGSISEDVVVETPDSDILADSNELPQADEVTTPEWEILTVDIPVTWTSEPDYDMDVEGVYVFTPVIEGYRVSAELPRITVTVEVTTMEMLGGTASTPAEIGDLETLQAVVTNAEGDLHIVLASGYSGTGTLTIPNKNNYNFTLDLNDQTLDGGSNSSIQHNGSGTLIITDSGTSGKVTSSASRRGTIVSSGNVELQGGMVSSSGQYVIENYGTGSVNVSGGTVSAGSYAYAIYNYGTGSVNVSGGTVNAGGSNSYAIYNHSTGNVSISGGIVSVDNGSAIYNNSTGIIAISGTAIVTSAKTDSGPGSATIYLGYVPHSIPVLEITGGTIENIATGNAIYNKSFGIIYVTGCTVSSKAGTAIDNEFGSVDIGSGTTTIMGGNMALNRSPYFYDFDNVKITASSTNIDGSDASEVSENDLDTYVNNYRYLRFEQGIAKVARIGTTDYYSLQEAVNAVTNGGTIELRTNTTLADAVTITSGESKSFTLDLRGKTLDSGTNTAIEHCGSGTLSIADTAGFGRITGTNAVTGTILLRGGSLAISGGTVENTAAGNGISNDGSGSVSILSGRSTISGGKMAMNVAPDLSYYTDVKITASITNTAGTDASEIILEYIDTDTKIQAYKYLRFEQGLHNVARIGSKGYPSLQEAINAVTNGDTIELLEDITLKYSVTIPYYTNISFTLDLKGNTIDGNTNTAVNYESRGTLTIADTAKGGKITSKNTSSGTIYLYQGSLVISGGTVENTFSGGATIISKSRGTVSVTGGTVSAIEGIAIYNDGTGKITISGTATVISTKLDSDYVSFSDTGTIYLKDGVADIPVLEITGGTVENTTTGIAIYNNATGKIKISGTATVTSAKLDSGSVSDTGTIYLKDGEAGKTVLEITGGTIENTTAGNAIYNIGSGSVSISSGMVSANNGTAIYNNSTGKIMISGTSTISGGNMAMNMVPDLSYFTNIKITASITNADGADASEITHDSIDSDAKVQVYKYLQFESFKVAQIGTTSYTSLEAAIAAVSNGGTVELLKDITLTAAVGTGYNKSFTLDLKGKTLDGGTGTAINHGGNGTLTITDTAGDGKITSTNIGGATIVSSGTVDVAGGTVIGTTGIAVVNYDNFIVSGGTVINISENCAIINHDTIEVTGGMVSATNNRAIDNSTYGTVNVSGGTVSANGGPSILNRGEGEITISGTALVTSDSDNSTIYLMDDNPYGYPLKIKGGTVENTAAGNAIYNRGYGHVEIFGGTISSTAGIAIETFISTSEVFVLEGTSTIIKGGYIPMNKFPIFYDYDNVRIRVSKTDGTDTSDVLIWYFLADEKKFKAYKYLMFEPATVPDAPTNLAATPLNGRLRLTWDAPVNNGGREITGYKISTDNGSSWTVSYSIYNPRTVDGLTNGATYTVLVRAFNEIGDGPVSDSITVTLPVPTYTIRGTIKDRDTDSGIDGAVVQLKDGSNNVGSSILTDSNGEYTISNVVQGTYSIEVSADGYDSGTIKSFFVYYNVTKKDLMLYKVGSFISVSDIALTDGVTVQVNTDLTLSGTVSPDTATNRTITWSIENANGTGATMNGNTFRATSPGNTTVKATVTNGLTSSSDFTKLFTITVLPAPVVTHTITATADDGGSISPNGSVTINDGTSQTFTITPSDNYSIADVKVDGVSQGSITSYTFHNVTANHTILATFSYNGGGGGSPSDNNGGGGSPSDNNGPVIVNPPTPDIPNSPTQDEIRDNSPMDDKGNTTLEGEGNTTVIITEKTMADAFDKALADAKKNGNEQNGITLVLNVSIGNKSANNVTVNLPKAVQETIIDKKIASVIVVVDNPDIRIDMDLAAIEEINKQAKSNVNITATRVEKLTGAAKNAIGSRPVFDLKVNYGSGKSVQNFGEGSISVTIPYILGTKENAGNVYAVYVDDKGKVHWLTSSAYDSINKVLRFSTSHFSTYGVGYKQDAPPLTDISTHWAKEAIEFVVSRGLISGTSAATFSPNTAMTRRMFVTALGRLADADVSKYNKSSSTDVKKDAYYMGYIERANKNSILNGTGSGKFVPNQSITREQMAVIMQKYAKVIGFKLPKVHEENTFADSTKISADAKDAVKQMQMAGVISGKNDNLFDPQGTATRAEVSALLHRFVELVITSDTMQGWTMNDSGQWMYYENGKPVTGKKDIDGLTYTFDQYGVTEDVPHL